MLTFPIFLFVENVHVFHIPLQLIILGYIERMLLKNRTLVVNVIGKVFKELQIQCADSYLTSQTSNYDVIGDARCKHECTVKSNIKTCEISVKYAFLPQIFSKMKILR